MKPGAEIKQTIWKIPSQECEGTKKKCNLLEDWLLSWDRLNTEVRIPWDIKSLLDSHINRQIYP
jgi:hypothetical protein